MDVCTQEDPTEDPFSLITVSFVSGFVTDLSTKSISHSVPLMGTVSGTVLYTQWLQSNMFFSQLCKGSLHYVLADCELCSWPT